MENAEHDDNTSTHTQQHRDDTPIVKKSGGSEFIVHGPVDIVDHYAINCDPKLNECSDSTQPLRPPRKYSDYSTDAASAPPSSRKASENLDTSPMKPSRKLSQCSTANRKFSTASDTSSIKTPKKVSFSDELPLATAQLATTASDAATAAAADAQIPTDYLTTLAHAIMDSSALESIQHSSDDDDGDDDNVDDDDESNHSSSADAIHYSSPSSSISTQTLNELTKADMFPNSRKVSLHSERSFDMGMSTALKPGTESATTQITTDTVEAVATAAPLDTFLDQERKMSTSSLKSNYCACQSRAAMCDFLFVAFASEKTKCHVQFPVDGISLFTDF